MLPAGTGTPSLLLLPENSPSSLAEPTPLPSAPVRGQRPGHPWPFPGFLSHDSCGSSVLNAFRVDVTPACRMGCQSRRAQLHVRVVCLASARFQLTSGWTHTPARSTQGSWFGRRQPCCPCPTRSSWRLPARPGPGQAILGPRIPPRLLGLSLDGLPPGSLLCPPAILTAALGLSRPPVHVVFLTPSW